MTVPDPYPASAPVPAEAGLPAYVPPVYVPPGHAAPVYAAPVYAAPASVPPAYAQPATPAYAPGYAPGYTHGYASGYATGYPAGYPLGGYAQPYGGGYGQPFAAPPPTNGLATTALVIGLASLLVGVPISIGVLGVIGGLVGIGIGIAALRRVRAGAPGRGPAIWGLITSGLAVVVGGLIFVAIIDDSGDDAADGSDGSLDLSYEHGWSEGHDQGYDEGYADATSDESDVRPAPGADEGEVAQVALGEVVTVGTYQVAVTDIQIDADTLIAEVTTDNYPPSGQYVVATLSVTNIGSSATRPMMELMAEYWGTDDNFYDEYTCSAFTTRPSIEVGLLAPGATAEYDVCMDVPVEVIGEVAVVVQDTRAWKFSGTQWTGI